MRLKLKHHPEIKPRFRLPLHVYMIYLLICTFLLTGVSFARYIATGSGSDGARVAAGAVEVSHDSNTKIEITRPTDDAPVTKGFSFTVSNKNSEVAIRYDVIVTLNEPLPEGVSMTVDGKPCPGSGTVFSFPNAGVFSAGSNEIKTHTISFTGNYMTIDEASSRTITISVQSEQIN